MATNVLVAWGMAYGWIIDFEVVSRIMHDVKPSDDLMLFGYMFQGKSK